MDDEEPPSGISPALREAVELVRRSRRELEKLLEESHDELLQLLADPPDELLHPKEDASASCSFCGKAEHEVARLVAGPLVYICNECVAMCNQILAEETSRG